MHQNQSSNRIYRQWRESDPTRPHGETGAPAFTNCLTVQWESGEEMIFYYAFLMSVRLYLPSDHNLLVLRFTSERLTLKGYRLKMLSRLFAHEKPSEILVINPRYIIPDADGQAVVIEAQVEDRKA